MGRFYVTTPIYYINAEPHLGHTYTMVIADTLARFHAARGEQTFLVTGTDEHGDKIAEIAKQNQQEPRAYADRVSPLFRQAWDACGFHYDQFVRTTDPKHEAIVQEFLSHVHANDDIYFSRYGGLYCTGCERFLTEKELVDGKCPDHQRAPTLIEEENYFFRMTKYLDRLRAHIESNPGFIAPERYRNEVLAMLESGGIGDLCISRPKSRLSWGIELPFDRNYVCYVWFDALISYVSGLKMHGESTFETLWPQAHHVMAKDILKPHAIYWPTMLMALGLRLPKRLLIHGYWVRGEAKMSKSLGNVIRPLDMKERFGIDALRYFLLREMAFGQDATFSEDAFITRVNADLANNLGNLVSRTLSMQQRYFKGVVQSLGELTADDRQLIDTFTVAFREVPQLTADLALHKALESLWRAVDHANKYIVVTAPFTLAKETAQLPRVGAILHHLLEALHATAQLLAWSMPETSARIAQLLGVELSQTLPADLAWGTHFAAGHLTQPPVVLFPRIEMEKG
ncbi:MAG TPA: methionine--tRNA ligase [Candidatus Acidoferrales bacterium]|nr:methionine--tRNA ligase [Candidatus Acidoferrales bacterium]